MKQRVLTALVLAPAVLIACVVRTPYPLFVICLIATTLGFWELRTMLGQPKALPILTLFGIAVPFFGTEVQSNRDPNQVILYASLFWLIGIGFIVFAVLKRKGSAASADLAGLWISMPMTCVIMMHKLIRSHPMPFYEDCWPLLIVLPLWAGDIAAMLVGKSFGKHLLWPALSPKKSWEGAIANLLLCIGTAGLTGFVIAGSQRLPVFLACGAVIGVFGQAGDLFESWIKRRSSQKDSGSILPGHGGILDRIDSLLVAAPTACLLLVFAFRH